MQRLRQLLVDFWIVIAFGIAAGLLVPNAHAGLIGTDEARAQDERAELSKALQKFGLLPAEAKARVDAMADAEVLQLAGRLDAALAGGQLTNEQILLIVIIVLLIIIIL